MLLVGGLLNASTVLQPQFSQQLLGYTATVAGEALTGGGLVLSVSYTHLVSHPVVDIEAVR